MSNSLKTAIICASAFAILAASAPASFAADSLEIRNFIGTINWSNGDMSAEIETNAGETKITGTRSLIVDGGQKDIDGSDCKSSYGKFNIDWFGKNKQGSFGGYKNLEDLPVLNISMPVDTQLILSDVIVFTEGAPNLGDADVELRHCGELTLGDVNGLLALDSRGSADVSVGTTGQLVANLKGSGDLTGADSQDVLIESRGSADVGLGNITSLESSTHGSGDISVQNIDGSAELSSHGSGDVDLGDVNGSLAYSGYGSGDLEISSVEGDKLNLQSYGSGDVAIGSGKVDEIVATVRGSATIDFSGEAETATLKSSGSGDIYVNRVTGAAEIKTSGSGDVDIDERG